MPRGARRSQMGMSMQYSALDVLPDELQTFADEMECLDRLAAHLGTENDTPDLRAAVQLKKSVCCQAEATINQRLTGDTYEEHEQQRVEELQKQFIELQDQYFMIIQCVGEKEREVGLPKQYQTERVDQLPVKVLPDGETAQNGADYSAQQNQPQTSNSGTVEQNVAQSAYPSYNEDEVGSMAPVLQQQYLQEQEQLQSGPDLEIEGLQLKYRDTIYWDTAEVERRDSEMEFLGNEMEALADTMQDASLEIQAQGTEVDRAEVHAAVAQENTKQAVKTLGKTSKAAHKVVLPGAGAVSGAVVGGIIGGVAFGPMGIIGGGAIGAAVGGASGYTANQGLLMITDKNMHKARLSDQWQPDKSAPNCNSCQKKFTTVKRRHHCRNCGRIFCGKCCKHKVKLPGVDSFRTPRVCLQCYKDSMYQPKTKYDYRNAGEGSAIGGIQQEETQTHSFASAPAPAAQPMPPAYTSTADYNQVAAPAMSGSDGQNQSLQWPM